MYLYIYFWESQDASRLRSWLNSNKIEYDNPEDWITKINVSAYPTASIADLSSFVTPYLEGQKTVIYDKDEVWNNLTKGRTLCLLYEDDQPDWEVASRFRDNINSNKRHFSGVTVAVENLKTLHSYVESRKEKEKEEETLRKEKEERKEKNRRNMNTWKDQHARRWLKQEIRIYHNSPRTSLDHLETLLSHIEDSQISFKEEQGSDYVVITFNVFHLFEDSDLRKALEDIAFNNSYAIHEVGRIKANTLIVLNPSQEDRTTTKTAYKRNIKNLRNLTSAIKNKTYTYSDEVDILLPEYLKTISFKKNTETEIVATATVTTKQDKKNKMTASKTNSTKSKVAAASTGVLSGLRNIFGEQVDELQLGVKDSLANSINDQALAATQRTLVRLHLPAYIVEHAFTARILKFALPTILSALSSRVPQEKVSTNLKKLAQHAQRGNGNELGEILQDEFKGLYSAIKDVELS